MDSTSGESDRTAHEAAEQFFRIMRRRRSVRAFSRRHVPESVVGWLIRTAGSAPSGANLQPWRFVCVSDPKLKARIRNEAEAQEQRFYEETAPEKFLQDLAPLGTTPEKPFLQQAPWLIIPFQLNRRPDGAPVYFPGKSAGIAVGFLLAAAHWAGLATLLYTPPRMEFLNELCARPSWEKPFCIIPLGYPDPSYKPPEAALKRKALGDIMVTLR